jgi:hypothetical protein
MDDRFLHSLTKYFVRSDLRTLIALRRSKLDILYLKLLQVREDAIFYGNPAVTFRHFDTLCSWCRVPSAKKDGNPVPPKARKQQVLEAFRKVGEATGWGYAVTPVCGQGQKRAYTFTLQLNLPESAAALKRQHDREDAVRLLDEVVLRELMAYYRMTLCPGQNPLSMDRSGFTQWMQTDCDFEEKRRVYMTAYDKVCGKATEKQRRFSLREADFSGFYRESVAKQRVGVHCRGLEEAEQAASESTRPAAALAKAC